MINLNILIIDWYSTDSRGILPKSTTLSFVLEMFMSKTEDLRETGAILYWGTDV